jgi:hypothetical protein
MAKVLGERHRLAMTCHEAKVILATEGEFGAAALRRS